MKSSYPVVPLKGHVHQISLRNKNERDVDVYSVTNCEGFKKSTDYFSKEVFSKDVSNYKVVSSGQFAYNPSRINVGSIDYLRCANKAIVSPLYIVFETSNEIYSDYLLRYLKSNWGNAQIRANTEGAVRDSLKFKGLENVKIPLPSVGDQIRIAHFLSKVEGLIAQRKQNLQQLDDLLKSVFLEMFGDPMRNEKGWDKKVFADLLTEIESGSSPKCEAREADQDEWGVLKLGAITSCFYRENENKALPPDIKPQSKHEVKNGDLLFSRKNTYDLVAASAYVFSTRPKMLMPDLIFRFVFKDDAEIDPIFIWKLLISDSQRRKIQSLAAGAAGSMPNISKANLRQVLLPIPPLPLQNKFAAIVETVEDIKSKYQQSLVELDNLYDAFSQEAFKGELDLSRVPMPDENEPKVHEVTLTDKVSVTDEVIRIVEYPMSVPAEREKLLRNLFDVYLAQNRGENLSLDDFWHQASFKVIDMMDEFDKSWGVKDYDQLKQWLFELINSGKIEQTQNIISEPDEDLAYGNQIVLKALS